MSKRPKDANELAKMVADIATGELVRVDTDKNPHAVALGRMGGLKGGKARADKLSPERKKEIATNAVKARWAKKDKKHPK